MPRKRWYEIWSAWAGLIFISFAVIEALAWNKGVTLSRTVWDLQEAWPLSGPLLGGLFFGLLVHFYWHWNPPGSKSEG